jgi:hypothetical protein
VHWLKNAGPRHGVARHDLERGPLLASPKRVLQLLDHSGCLVQLIESRGCTLQASHSDPRTTMRYNRGRLSLDRHATYVVAAFVAGAAR